MEMIRKLRSLRNFRISSMEEDCFNRLKFTNGPIIYKNSKICEFDCSTGVVLTNRPHCKIYIRNDTGQWIGNGLGCYYGYGHVLTAYHVIKDAANSEILVIFCTGDTALIYKALYKNSCNTDPDQDQAFIQLFGNTAPLGPGLQNQIGKIKGNENIYFYSITPDGNFQKQEGEILRPNSSMRAQMCTDGFIISVAGKCGDSGSPVYNTKDELIGVYRGCFMCPDAPNYGYCTKISPQFLPWA